MYFWIIFLALSINRYLPLKAESISKGQDSGIRSILVCVCSRSSDDQSGLSRLRMCTDKQSVWRTKEVEYNLQSAFNKLFLFMYLHSHKDVQFIKISQIFHLTSILNSQLNNWSVTVASAHKRTSWLRYPISRCSLATLKVLIHWGSHHCLR